MAFRIYGILSLFLRGSRTDQSARRNHGSCRCSFFSSKQGQHWQVLDYARDRPRPFYDHCYFGIRTVVWTYLGGEQLRIITHINSRGLWHNLCPAFSISFKGKEREHSMEDHVIFFQEKEVITFSGPYFGLGLCVHPAIAITRL